MMGMKYDLSVIEILNLLGYTTPTARAKLEGYVQEKGVRLPTVLYDFLSFATDNPLFSTSDVWTTRKPKPFFFYQEIEERIEEDKECWEETPNAYEDDEYYQFSQIPKEQWFERVSDYLEIGSDYGAGVVTFGICITDLDDNNPPVYMLYEANSLTEWVRISDKLSDYLMMVICDVLSCVEYQTAQEVLEEFGWNYQKYNDSSEVKKLLSAKAINLSMTGKYTSLYGTDAEMYCCYDDVQDTLYVIRKDKINYEMFMLSK